MERQAGEWIAQPMLMRDVETVMEWGRSHPDAFGGAWLANRDERSHPTVSRLVVGLIRDDGSLATEVLSFVEHSGAVDFVAHERPLRALRSLQDRLGERFMRLREPAADSPFVSAVGVDVVANQLSVQLSAPDDVLAAEVLAFAPGWIQVEDHYGVATRY